MVEPTVTQWHEQFVRQARWTQGMRNHLYRRANLLQAQRVLDVGCGTGVITNELARRTRGVVTGVDIDPRMLALAQREAARARYQEGDALDLPFPDEHFDVVTCHFLLLWVPDPGLAMHEMARVTRRKGSVLVCAEPDYGGRLDWPDLPIRQWQIDGLRRQGADPFLGRRLRELTIATGLHAEVGVMPSQWDTQALRESFEAEWAWLEHDVRDVVDPSTLAQAKARAKSAVDAGSCLMYIPVFFARGRKT
jgi:ubiquinone/menaquinone biosynthesis C-methylase UbiE